jgi:hypothetical protein
MADVLGASPTPAGPDSSQEAMSTDVTQTVNDPEDPNQSPLGVYAPFPYSPEPFANLSDLAKSALMQLDSIASKTDVAARRMEVEQTWEACHFDRGYQHLLRGIKGGWIIPGVGTGQGNTARNYNSGNIFDTNVYGPKGDIIVAALSREVPKQEFFPGDPDYGPDCVAAEEANKFKDIWVRMNDLHSLLVDIARIFWNEDRVLLWTRYELNGQLLGFEEPDKQPLVPENLFDPPDDSLTGQSDQEDTIAQETSALPTGMKPLGMEKTSCYGRLDHKVPIAVDKLEDMQFVQIYLDLDVAIVKAMFPWISTKIKPGSDGTSEVELDRIARENVRQAVLGAYVTGDSLKRHCVVKFTWLRPSMFLDEAVSDAARAELMEAFPNGCLMAKAADVFAFARNESMDDHLVVGHALTGKGQNRRALGTALIAIQKRINDWVDLLDDFFKRTVPRKWFNAEAFDMEAMKKVPNLPGSIGPFQPQPGLTAAEQYMMVEPTPQPQPALPEFIQWFITNLSEEVSGALPSLFGAPTNTDTVGGIEIQRDQALQRIGCPWNSIQIMFAKAAEQAVKAAAECRDGKPINQNVPGKGNITVNTANLVGGKTLCYPESNPAFPESWHQREEKLMKLIDISTQNPAVGQFLFSPNNLPILADGIRIKDFKVAGATSVTKQHNEFELLLRAEPQPNPMIAQMQEQMQQVQMQAQQAQNAGGTMGIVTPEAVQANQLAQQQLAQMEQQIAQLPPQVSSIPVAQDESEDHAIEAGVCFEWMNSADGQKFKYGTPEQQAAYENVHLHWQEHTQMAKQLAPPGEQKPPSESISVDVSKMPPEVAAQALSKMGIMATPDVFQQHAEQQVREAIQKRAIPDALKGPKEAPQPPQQQKGQGPPKK